MKKIMLLVVLVAATVLSTEAQGYYPVNPGRGNRGYRRYLREKRALERMQRLADLEYYRNTPIPNVSNGEVPMVWDVDNPYRPFWPTVLSYHNPKHFGTTNCGNIVFYNCYQGIQGIAIVGTNYVVAKYGKEIFVFRRNTLIRHTKVYQGIQLSLDMGTGILQVAVKEDTCYLIFYTADNRYESYRMY